MTQVSETECQSYVGRQRRIHDSLSPEAAARLAVVLGAEIPDKLPPTWHWAYFNPAVPLKDVGHDGHEKLGLFMPPAPFKKRMWAGGEIVVHKPLLLSVPAERVSTIAEVAFKTGRTGAMCFVRVEHDIRQNGALMISEVQTIVYRDGGLAEGALRDADDPVPDGYRLFPDTQLMAYSSVTQNGHRIHWDRDFCRNVEGYPGLVVHGPLLATTLADALLPAPAPCRFSYRAKAPVFETSPVRVITDGAEARIERVDGVIAMEAKLTPY